MHTAIAMPDASQLCLPSSRLLQVIIVFVRQRQSSGVGHFLLVLFHDGLVYLNLGSGECGFGDEFERLVSDKLSRKPEEGLLKVVVGFGRDIVVLKVLLAMEGDGLRLDLSLLYVDLVSTEDNWNVLADTDKIT